MSFKYSVVSDTIRRLGYNILESPEEIFSAIKAAGYDGVDIPGGHPEQVDAKGLRQLADSLGLEIPEVAAAWAYFHAGENRDLAGSDEEARVRGIAYAKQAVDLAVALGSPFFQICAAQPAVPQVPFPKLPIQILRKNLLAATKEICEYAAEREITILFEPLNRYEAYPGLLTTVYEAINLIKALGLPNVGIQPDIYHMNIGEASIPEALRAAGSHLKVMHINETNHYYLGEGHADYKGILRTLKEMGFDGWLSVYMPLISQEVAYSPDKAGSVNRPNLQSVLERQLRFLKEMERAVDGQTSLYRADAAFISEEETAGFEEGGEAY